MTLVLLSLFYLKVYGLCVALDFLDAFYDFILEYFLTRLVVSKTLSYAVILVVKVAMTAHHDELRLYIFIFFI